MCRTSTRLILAVGKLVLRDLHFRPCLFQHGTAAFLCDPAFRIRCKTSLSEYANSPGMICSIVGSIDRNESRGNAEVANASMIQSASRPGIASARQSNNAFRSQRSLVKLSLENSLRGESVLRVQPIFIDSIPSTNRMGTPMGRRYAYGVWMIRLFNFSNQRYATKSLFSPHLLLIRIRASRTRVHRAGCFSRLMRTRRSSVSKQEKKRVPDFVFESHVTERVRPTLSTNHQSNERNGIAKELDRTSSGRSN